MNRTERRSVASLGSIFLLRMFGLFLLLPILAVHTEQYDNATPFYAGLALGIYGLTQALLQIPYGMASDRLGRKKVIAFGLLVFMLGSVIAAMADTVIWLIIGRAIQGAGAISSAVLALTADLTREQQRTKSMAIIGVSIGFAFLLSLILAPILNASIGVSGIFWMIAALSGLAIVILYKVVPNPAKFSAHRDILPIPKQFTSVLSNPQLLRLDFGIFCLHLILTALFVVTPMILIDRGGVELSSHWKLYLPILLASAIGMLPFIKMASKPGFEFRVFKMTVALLLVALSGLSVAVQSHFGFVIVFLIVFFSAFNSLESMLPSLVSRIAPATIKGTAMGVYNSFQFFGMFIGGVGAGMLYGEFGLLSVYLFCGAVALLWLIVSLTGSHGKLLINKIISIADFSHSQRGPLIDRISGLNGVEEVAVAEGETTAYLSVDPEIFDENELEQLLLVKG